MNIKMTKNIIVFAAIFIFGLLTLFGCARGLLHSGQTNFNNTIAYSLPKGYIHIKSQNNTLTVETDYEPDQNQYYLLQYTTNIGFDDDITITTDDNKAFLKSISSTTTSKVSDIIQKLTQIPLAALRVPMKATALPNFDLILDPKDIKEYNPQTIAETMRLYHLSQGKVAPGKPITEKQRQDADKAKEQLSAMGGNLYRDYNIAYISLEHPKANFLYTGSEQSAAERPSADNQGICYRAGLPFRLRLLIGDNYWDQIVYLPNYSKLITFDVSRPVFVQKVQSLTFTNGMLTQVHLKKDSELLAFLGIPASLVKTVAGLPLDLISVRTSDLGTQAALINAQTTLIQAQQNLQKAQNPTGTQ